MPDQNHTKGEGVNGEECLLTSNKEKRFWPFFECWLVSPWVWQPVCPLQIAKLSEKDVKELLLFHHCLSFYFHHWLLIEEDIGRVRSDLWKRKGCNKSGTGKMQERLFTEILHLVESDVCFLSIYTQYLNLFCWGVKYLRSGLPLMYTY